MGLFVLSAKTPGLLFHVLLLLATAKSLHADETTAATGPSGTTPTVGDNGITIEQTNATTQSLSANATALNGTTPQTDILNTTEHTGNSSVSNTTDITISDAITTPLPNITALTSARTNDTASTTIDAFAEGNEGGSDDGSAGPVILVVLLLAIISLGVLLYYMRKKSRSYSFDLFTPVNDQASDNAPLKPLEMETFQPKDTETPVTLPTVVIESAENQPDSPIANGSVEEGPGDPAITLDNESIKSAPSECGSQTEFLPKDSTDVDVEQQPGNENNNNFAAGTKTTAGLKSGEANFTEISLN
ncbi:uncharacterized protein LOC134060282 [Sardina pilchardus]|uniref:uncharacterized protein LOC134060282 n=1 Tax=Sardina pilchardus TaxID=27697 RepID=UPI002E12FDA8